VRLHFIVGSGRCGSSLIHEILCRHEDVGFLSNVEDNLPWLGLNGRFNNWLYSATRGAWTRKSRLRFAPSEAYRLISREVSPLYADSCRDLTRDDVTPWLRQRFERFFAERFDTQGKSTFLHKYTGWPRMGFFAEIFPHARFIHVVRDGRAVANSLLQMNWWDGYRGPERWHWGVLPEEYRRDWEASERSFVVLAGMTWRVLMDSFDRAASHMDPHRYTVVRYEDFLDRPRESLQSMAAFLELSWSKRLASALEQLHIDRTKRRAYDHELTAEQRYDLERYLAPALARYGYDL